MKIHKKEPVVLIGLIASALVFALGHLGIILDHATVQAVIEPLVVAALARPFVTPKAKAEIEKAELLAEALKKR